MCVYLTHLFVTKDEKEEVQAKKEQFKQQQQQNEFYAKNYGANLWPPPNTITNYSIESWKISCTLYVVAQKPKPRKFISSIKFETTEIKFSGQAQTQQHIPVGVETCWETVCGFTVHCDSLVLLLLCWNRFDCFRWLDMLWFFTWISRLLSGRLFCPIYRPFHPIKLHTNTATYGVVFFYDISKTLLFFFH